MPRARKPRRDASDVGSANPLAAAFAEVIDTPYGPATLTDALAAVLPHLDEATRRRVKFKYLAGVLSRVLVAAGRDAVSADSLRGLTRRVRARANVTHGAQGVARAVPSPPIAARPVQRADPPSPVRSVSLPGPVRSASLPPAPEPGPTTAPSRAATAGGLSERVRRLAAAQRALDTR